MGYVDVGEEDYWEAEGGDNELEEDDPADHSEQCKKRKKAEGDPKGKVYISRCD